MVNRICKECGKEFKTHSCYLKRGGGIYCSRQCSDKSNICMIDGCGGKVQGHGYCGKHYMRIRLHGTLDIECQSRRGSRNGMYGVQRNGENAPFFGKKHSKESIYKISASKIGKKQTDESNNRRSNSLKGRVFSEEHKRKIGKAHEGKVVPIGSIEKMRKSLTGRKLSLEHRDKLSGSNHPNWKGGITPVSVQQRNCIELSNWRKSVYIRDNYTCVICGAKGQLNADHIKPFSLYPELRFDVNNGRTLCVPCHKLTDTYAGKSKIKQQHYYEQDTRNNTTNRQKHPD